MMLANEPGKKNKFICFSFSLRARIKRFLLKSFNPSRTILLKKIDKYYYLYIIIYM